MSHTNLSTAIIKSFYSSKLYQEVAQNWHGRSFLYLLVLLLICWVIMAGTITFKANTEMHMFAQKITTMDIPSLHFKKGIASTKATTPYYIKDHASGKTVIIIDTNNKIRNFHHNDATILIQKKSISVKDNTTNKISQYYYSNKMNLDIGPKQIKNFIQSSSKWITPLTFIIILFAGLILAYIYRIIQILIYALIGKLFCLILKRRMFYESLISLSTICITPAIIISTIASICELSFQFETTLYFLILELTFYFLVSMTYLFIAIKANPRSEITVSTQA